MYIVTLTTKNKAEEHICHGYQVSKDTIKLIQIIIASWITIACCILECKGNYYKASPKGFVNKCIKLTREAYSVGKCFLVSSWCLENSSNSPDECLKQKLTSVPPPPRGQWARTLTLSGPWLCAMGFGLSPSAPSSLPNHLFILTRMLFCYPAANLGKEK